MTLFLTAVGALLVLGFMGTEVYLAAHYWPEISNSNNFEKIGSLLQAMFAPLVSVLTIAFSYLVINRQFRLNEEIEKTKQRLGERYKRESDAYFQVWSAIAAAYRKLSDLEKGQFHASTKDVIEAKFAEAEPYAFVISKEHESLFYSYWQEVRETLAAAEQAADDAARKTVWTRHVKTLGDRYHRIRTMFRSHYLGDLA